MTTERWRFCCPECESHALVARVSGGYRCEVCRTVVERKYDKKHGKLTA
jgi:Zn finger protein HypA/HybF involved in hydrogenase expression